MCIRKATYADYQHVKRLPVQLTCRPLSGLQHKHYKMLYHEANVQLFVSQTADTIRAFMAVRRLRENNALAITHLSLDHQAFSEGVGEELEYRAGRIAAEQRCNALVVKAKGLPPIMLDYYYALGYTVSAETLIKKI